MTEKQAEKLIKRIKKGGSQMKNYINNIMTIIEASERYEVNLETLKNKFKASVTGKEKIEKWKEEGLIRQSGKTWLITVEFMELNFKK